MLEITAELELKTIEERLKVKITREVPISLYPFKDYFKGFEKVEAVRQIFGKRTDEVLNNLKVEFAGTRGYMGVNPLDGHVLIGANYLRNGDLVDIYLDIIHELVHVRQFMDGKELFDDNFSYIDRPTELEAYRHTVDEARRIGLNDDRILQYLKTEWMTDEDVKSLARALNIDCR
jgi:hypothetical protein